MESDVQIKWPKELFRIWRPKFERIHDALPESRKSLEHRSFENRSFLQKEIRDVERQLKIEIKKLQELISN